jgi:hypothetical protein
VDDFGTDPELLTVVKLICKPPRKMTHIAALKENSCELHLDSTELSRFGGLVTCVAAYHFNEYLVRMGWEAGSPRES